MKKDIYLIELYRIKEDARRSKHTVGFYFEYEDAYNAIQKNWLDLADSGNYNYCCIRPYEEGVHSFQLRRPLNWFHFDEDDGWIECVEP